MGEQVKNDGAKNKSAKTIDIVVYAFKMSVNGVTCVCSPFLVIKHISSLSNYGLTVNNHISNKNCVTGQNWILHKALSDTVTTVQSGK